MNKPEANGSKRLISERGRQSNSDTIIRSCEFNRHSANQYFSLKRKINVFKPLKETTKLVTGYLRIVAADSGAALLNERFEPLQVVAACSGLVEPPYTKVTSCLAEPIFAEVEDGHRLVVHELELCMNILRTVKADVVHLDMSFGGLSLEELSAVSLSQMHVSGKTRGNVLKILPQLRKIALDIKRVYSIDVLAIGKESVPVRVAELTAGAYAVLYSAEKVVKEKEPVLLGLPAKCTAKRTEEGIIIESLLPAEQDLTGHAKDENKVLDKVQIKEMPNPCARGFRLLEIVPKIAEI